MRSVLSTSIPTLRSLCSNIIPKDLPVYDRPTLGLMSDTIIQAIVSERNPQNTPKDDLNERFYVSRSEATRSFILRTQNATVNLSRFVV
jgi:hypothetical protein